MRSIEVARFSPRRTLALAATIAAVSIGWASAAVDSEGGQAPPSDPIPKGLSAWIATGVRLAIGIAR